MKKNLYMISTEIESVIENAVDAETGEIVDEQLIEKLNELQIEKEQLIEEVCLEIKNTEAYSEALKAEKKAIADKQSAAERHVESLKKYVKFALNNEKLKTSKVSVSYRKTKAVEFEGDPTTLPIDCIKTEITVKKKAVKEHLDAGENIPGAKIVERTSMIIK